MMTGTISGWDDGKRNHSLRGKRESTLQTQWRPHARLLQFGRRRSHGSAEDARPSGTPSARLTRAANAQSMRRLRGSVGSARTSGVPRVKPNRAVDLNPSAPAVGGLVTPGASAMLEPTRVVGRLGRRPHRLEPVIGAGGRGIMCLTAMQAPTGMGMT
jgi:hypothetical protein